MNDVRPAAESLMTALAARTKSMSVENERAAAELLRISELINDTASDGRTRVQLPRKLMDSVVRHLQSKGYEVNYWSDQRDNSEYTTIDWGNN